MNLSSLNPQQLSAVKYTEGPILIFAGAGSGKTRVLTHKIAFLIQEKGYQPNQILAVTFTNKAAKEMKLRVQNLLPKIPVNSIKIGTFHSICARILRNEIYKLGYTSAFTIYDQKDVKNLLKDIIKKQNYDLQQFSPSAVNSYISKLKNSMVYPNDLLSQKENFFEKRLSLIYDEYQKQLKVNNAVDFDDLILLTIKLFENDITTLNKYQKKIKYILVDEYQDTNKTQFQLIQLLSNNKCDICVVGDDDQSIYGWRGADIKNILEFKDNYENPKIFKLEQNYRSTEIILSAAYSVIKNNKNRANKKIWSDKNGGNLISLHLSQDERFEARKIIQNIHLEYKNGRNYEELVILYRTNAQSRAIEDELRKNNIPYKIVGGVKFYDRKEIKDILSYLRLIINPKDNLSFERIINFPARGIGKTTINKIKKYAEEEKISLLDTIAKNLSVGKKQLKSIDSFRNLILDLSLKCKELNPTEIIKLLIEKIQLKDYYNNQISDENIERWANIEELISTISEYSEINPNLFLKDFLEEVSLLTDIDRWNNENSTVTLMTLHTAKGLEFPVVFICGLEEGLFPIVGALEEENELEEERRLFYVGLTRAMEKVYLTHAQTRRRFGGTPSYNRPSQFIKEIPNKLLINEENTIINKPEINYTYKDKSQNHNNNIPSKFKVGGKVYHKLFGTGTIINIQGIGDEAKFTIKFSGNQIKKLIKKYANLSPI
tara:strand:+ start:227 stop:2377 length:2151 start_codon:yes stop_codon:yes gene_type:complete